MFPFVCSAQAQRWPNSMPVAFYKNTHAFPQRLLHHALPAQRRKRHVPNRPNIWNGAGGTGAPTNPAHCTNHLVPTSPIQVCCSLKMCVRFPHKTVSSPVHVCPKFLYSRDAPPAIYGIYWCPADCPLYPKGSQRHEPCPYATDKKHVAHVG